MTVSELLETACRAKINLYLRVLGKRADGYHEVETLLQEIDLADTLQFEPSSESFSLVVKGANLGDSRENLVMRAAHAFAEAASETVGGRFLLTKNIPAGGGLGGGSSDAAGALRLLNRAYPGQVEKLSLHRIAAELGSDVPFFLEGGCQVGKGTGSRLSPATPPANCSHQGYLFFPGIPLSTPRVYGALNLPGDAPSGEPVIGENHLTPAAIAVSDQFRDVYAALRRVFSEKGRFFMSGSGSSLVWLTPESQLNPAQEAILKRFGCRFQMFRFH